MINNYDFNKPMDIEISNENLELFCKTLYSKNIKIFLIFGTLLGLFRDKKLIKGDNDIDLAIFHNQKDDLISLEEDFQKLDFKIVKKSKSIISILRKGNHIDITILHKINFPFSGWISGVFFIPNKYLVSLDKIIYKNFEYFCPSNPELILEHFYGKEWKIPSNKTAKISLVLLLIQKYIPKKLIKYFTNKFFSSN